MKLFILRVPPAISKTVLPNLLAAFDNPSLLKRSGAYVASYIAFLKKKVSYGKIFLVQNFDKKKSMCFI